MELDDLTPAPSSNGSWRTYLAIIVCLVIVTIFLNLSGSRLKSAIKEPDLVSRQEFLTGDTYVRQAISSQPLFDRADSAKKAIAAYEQIGNDPSVIRRIALVKELLLNESGRNEIKSLGDPNLFKGYSKSAIAKLTSESKMWLRIFDKVGLTTKEATQYVQRIRALDLGPLKDYAVAAVYSKSGQSEKAQSIKTSASQRATQWLIIISIGFALGAAAGVAGIVLCIIFLSRYAIELNNSPAPNLQADNLLLSFLVYLIGYSLLEVAGSVLADGFGISETTTSGIVTRLCFQLIAIVLAFTIGLSAFRNMALVSGENIREIGLNFRPLSGKIMWGIGAYCAALPLLGLASLVWNSLSETIFKNVQTPEHPIIELVTKGGMPFLLVFVLAVFAAPIVEETFFRGMLYTALRTKMGVWPAAIFAGTLFAALHPTFPGQFLPLLALAVVLALVRERTNSLLPGMICHGINNAIALVLVLLVY